jgi:phosphoribosylformylglycinamidine synthase
MVARIEVRRRAGVPDPAGDAIVEQAVVLGVQGLRSVRTSRLYWLAGELDAATVSQIADELLVDPVVEEIGATDPSGFVVEVAWRAGVTDTVAETLIAGARCIGVDGVRAAATGTRYELQGELSEDDVTEIARRLLANEVVQTFVLGQIGDPPLAVDSESDDTVEIISLRDADDERLMAVSRERRLSLDLTEMRAIRAWYEQEGREPTDVELEMLAQTWSEHCVHKTFRAHIDYTGPEGRTQVRGLLNTYIRAATETVAKPWVRSAFVDNAGIVAFDDRYDLAIKVETHNHPSAIEPFGGANTGAGGCIRDVIGVSARPIANMDVLCFGPPDTPLESLPSGVLHPRRIADGVIHGIEDYGNKMGIPTVNGAVVYHEGYTANPLVYCGCLGILPRGSHPTEARVGDLLVALGGRTGRDGIRGATFSSMEMDHETSEIAGSSVQIGHPVCEKQAMEVVLRARDEGLYTAITDCGAGGFSSAVGEMGEELGVEVELSNVPLKYAGLSPWEIWLSEAQERMVIAVPPQHLARVEEICEDHGCEPTVLGRFTGEKRILVTHKGKVVADLATEFLHNGIPVQQMTAVWAPPVASEPAFEPAVDLTPMLLAILARPDTRSKADVVHRYDHEVQGGTIGKPLVGDGPGDAAVVVPQDSWRAGQASGVQPAAALSVGICPQYGALDPYAMAWAAVDEAVRNAVAVGADPDRIAILDNFCWGNPRLPDRLGALVRCSQGCHDAAVAYGTPYVSGKDSLNNEYTGADGRKHAIPGTILISALGIVPDINHTATSALAPGSLLYLVGETRDELGASAYYDELGFLGANVPQPPNEGLVLYRALHGALASGLVAGCHDCSEGGIAVAAAEMAMCGRVGVTVAVPSGWRADKWLFSESQGRLLVSVAREDSAAFEAALGGRGALVGEARADDRVEMGGAISASLAEVRGAWSGHLM